MWLSNRRGRADAERRARAEWTCHVCGALRPDENISVLSRMTVLGKVPVQENVRYCNDRVACVEGAKDVSWIG